MEPIEITSTRLNPHVDPVMTVWAWEIPVYLFVGGLIAGMMVIGGVNMVRLAKGESSGSFYSVQAPILGLLLLNVGMFALFLDLENKVRVYRVYMAFEPTAPMSWGSWILLLVYPILAVSALIRLPRSWPWLGKRLPILSLLSRALTTRPRLILFLGRANVLVGIGLGTYTGILLSTMVARPLWNSAILGPLFLVSGLSTAAALLHLFAGLALQDPSPRGFFGGAIRSLVQPLGAEYPARGTEDRWTAGYGLVRADQVLLATELFMIGLFFLGLISGSASQIASIELLTNGGYAILFWVVVIAFGLVIPLILQGLQLAHKIPHSAIPAVLVLVGGFALRWVLVGAGQASTMAPAGLL